MATSTKAQVLRYALLSKDILNSDEMELYELAHLAGVVMDPNVFKYAQIFITCKYVYVFMSI